MRVFLTLSLILVALSSVVLAQEVWTHDKVDYSFDIPSPTWRAISEPDAAHGHPEFVYGDRLDGYLTVRKEVVEAGTTAAELARRDQDQKLRFLPGFIEGKQEIFNGRLDGVTISYEFTSYMVNKCLGVLTIFKLITGRFMPFASPVCETS